MTWTKTQRARRNLSINMTWTQAQIAGKRLDDSTEYIESSISSTLSSDSKEAQAWLRNQTHCRLFQLPAELRLTIYELVMGRHTIFIQYGGHQYVMTRENGKQRLTSYPLHGFHCTRLPLGANPYVTLVNADEQRSLRGQQLLNNICRELYTETAELPYKWNVWSWANFWDMRKMLVEDKMLPLHNLRAINTIFASRSSWFPGVFEEKDFLFPSLKVLYKNRLRTVTKHIENFEHEDDPAEEYQKTQAQIKWTRTHGDPPYDFL